MKKCQLNDSTPKGTKVQPSIHQLGKPREKERGRFLGPSWWRPTTGRRVPGVGEVVGADSKAESDGWGAAREHLQAGAEVGESLGSG